MKKHKLYVYGTLMKGEGEQVQVPGRLYAVSWYPGAKIGTPEDGENFLAEMIEVTDEKLEQLDRYEGYVENNPSASLFIRRPYLDGFIYEYNRDITDEKQIMSGSWQAYKSEKEAA